MHKKILPYLGLCALAAMPLQARITDLFINEIRIDEPGADLNEFAELLGPPGMSLDNVWYIVLGDHSGEGNFKGSGVVEFAINLTGFTIGDDGFFLIANSSADLFDISKVDIFINNDSFENRDNVTHMLVYNYQGPEVTSIADQLGDLAVDIDDNDDGIPNTVLPWDYVIDAIGVVHNLFEGEFPYGVAFGFTDIGPDGTVAPGHVFRYSDTMQWAIGQFDPLNPLAVDTPRAVNPVAPQAPNITDISSLLVQPGDVLVLVGQRLDGVTSVTFNGTVAQVSRTESNRLDLVVPNVSGVQTITLVKSIGSFDVPFRVAVLSSPEVIFFEAFDEAGTLGRFTQFSVEGAFVWARGAFAGVGSARLNGFSDTTANDDWLITESLDLSDAGAAVFNFRTAGNFTGPDLELYVSANYTGGNPSTADWTQITDFNLALLGNFVTEESGMISLEPWLGESNVRIAIRYISQPGSGNARSWQVHEFTVWTGELAEVEANPNPFLGVEAIEGWKWIALPSAAFPSAGMWLYDAHWPYVFSDEHGWLYIYAGDFPSLFLYDFVGEVGWAFTAPGIYPWLYSFAPEGWVFYFMNSGRDGVGRSFFRPQF